MAKQDIKQLKEDIPRNHHQVEDKLMLPKCSIQLIHQSKVNKIIQIYIFIHFKCLSKLLNQFQTIRMNLITHKILLNIMNELY